MQYVQVERERLTFACHTRMSTTSVKIARKKFKAGELISAFNAPLINHFNVKE